MRSLKELARSFDNTITTSTFGRVFRLDGSGHPQERKNARFFTEVRAGLTTFFTMAYIIAVNSTMISQTGGTCVCHDTTDPSCANDVAYSSCKLDIKRDLVTATTAISGIASLAFGFFTNLPIALAPGMGLNAYFTYEVVGYHGTGPIPYRIALTAVFIEGFIFVFFSLIGMRQWLVRIIPESIKVASGVGIGLFLTTAGLSYNSGIGAITGSKIAPVTLAGCPPEYLDPTTGACNGHLMQNPQLWIGVLCGGILTAYLMAFRVKLAIIIGITLVSVISWPRSTSFTYFDYSVDGTSRFDFFKQVVGFHPIRNTLAVQDWNLTGAGSHFVLALFTFLYVDIIDCTASLYSMARFSGVIDPETGDFPRSTIAFCIDAICISIGSILGLSPVTAFVESGAGIAAGGRTGLTAMTTGVCFLLSIFFAPIFASVPPWATGCTLILVGCMMMRQVSNINWKYIGDAIPAFVTLSFMPLSYSVAYGLIAGLMVYIALNGSIYITKVITTGYLVPPDADLAEYWTFVPRGGKLPWFMRAARSVKRYWWPQNPMAEKDTVSEFEMVDAPHAVVANIGFKAASSTSTRAISTKGSEIS